MNLIDENEEKEQAESKQKLIKIIVFSIIFLVFVVVALLVFSNIKNKNTLKLKLNGKNQTISSGLILMSDNSKNVYIEDNHIYLSVRKLKELLGDVELYNDEYKNKGEDSTKCHVKVGNEYTSFISNSQEIYKAVIYEEPIDEQTDKDKTKSTSTNNKDKTELVTEYEYFTVEKPVKYVNGEIYASDDAIALGFNILLSYDQNNKTVNIYTLNSLETAANEKITTNTGVIGDDCNYSNKKLLKYGLMLVKNSDGNLGIANYQTNKEIMTCSYSNLRFIESTKTVVVTSADTGLQGVYKLDLENQSAATKIKPIYQTIRQIDEDLELYVVKTNNKYGIIKISGDKVDTVLQPEYEQIGLDDIYENMDNKYIIKGNKKYIPVKIDEKWGIVTADGSRAINTQYNGIGCTSGNAGNPVIILQSLVNGADVFVCQKMKDPDPNDTKSQGTKYYKLVNAESQQEIGYDASEIYSKYEEGDDGDNKTVYYMKLDVNGTLIRDIDIYQTFGKKSQKITNQQDIEKNIDTNTTNSNTNNNTNTTNNNQSTNTTSNNQTNITTNNNTSNSTSVNVSNNSVSIVKNNVN